MPIIQDEEGEKLMLNAVSPLLPSQAPHHLQGGNPALPLTRNVTFNWGLRFLVHKLGAIPILQGCLEGYMLQGLNKLIQKKH